MRPAAIHILALKPLTSNSPGGHQPARKTRLKTAFDPMGRFIGGNTASVAGFAPTLSEIAIAARAADGGGARLSYGKRLQPGSYDDLAGTLSYIPRDEFLTAMDEMPERPRLPVMTPCL
ncbi:hypothetical protein SAMN05519105_2444 [Rhodobacter sp. 24-YEA-8]|nr:hypothetical protein SAMN05519105_2444 [Rhodobacter sp. 24-YEA-8]